MGTTASYNCFRRTMAIAVAMSILIGAMPILAPLPAEAAPNPIPIVSVSLYPTQQRAEVTNEEADTVSFGGNLTVEQLDFITTDVTLTASISEDWEIVILPDSHTFQQSGTVRFTVTVRVPAGTNSTEEGDLVVTASAKVPILAPIRASASAVVTVRNSSPTPVWNLRITSPVQGAVVGGSSVTVRGTVTFTGGVVNMVEARYCDGPWVTAVGKLDWSVELDCSNFENGPHTITARAKAEGSTSKPVYLNITQDKSAAPGVTGNPSGPSQPGTSEDETSPYFMPMLLIMVTIGAIVGAYLSVRRKRNSTGRPNLVIHNL
jgi:hypothetical protein